MKEFGLISFCLLYALGCGGSEQPVTTVEDEEHLEAMWSTAPEGEFPTTVVYIPAINVSGAPFRVKYVGGGLEKVFVYRDGMVEEAEIHFQESRVYYFRGTFEPAVGIGAPKGDEYLYFNVLDDNIPYRPTDEEREQIVAEFHKERGIARDEPLGIGDSLELYDRIHHNEPFKPGDEIEVVVKHRVKLKKEKHVKANPQFQIREKIIHEEMEMIFVDVLRNLTRPHVNDSFQ